ncbi:MAG: heme lyase CcmF/NrfE family subunit [Actinomycetes bacterium]
MIGAIGTAAIVLALGGAGWLTAAGWRVLRGRGTAPGLRRPVTVLVAGAVAAMVALEVALLADDFSVVYVATNSARSTPLVFKIATAWAALEGSIVLWGLVLAGYVWGVAHRVGPGDRLGAGALMVLGMVAIFFFGLMATAANPFGPVADPPLDGPGPNPLLQNHLLMAVHPPLLYLGYVGFTVPFAFGMSALLVGDAGRQWLWRTRRAGLVAWSFLTAGIVVGGWWSYEVLGWGGYWAWDPVENASFMPWLTGTAFIHSAVAQSRRGMLKAWNVVLVIVTFALTILGTFLTRSGVIASVHSFTQSAVGPALLGFLGVVLVAALGLFVARGHLVSAAPRLESYVSREGGFLLNNVLLSVFAFTVLVGTTYPIVVEAVTGSQVSVGRPFFDRVAIPLSLALVVAMGVGPLLPYRATDGGWLWRRTQTPLLVGLATGAAAVGLGLRNGYVVAVLGLAVAIAAAAGLQLVRDAAAVPGGRAAAMLRVVARRPGFWGGQLAHLGVAVVAVAIAVSSTLGRHDVVTLSAGEQVELGPITVVEQGRFSRSEPLRDVTGVRVAVRRDGRTLDVLEPRLNTYRRQGQAIGTPAVRSTWRGDTYLALRRFDDDVVALDVYQYPFMYLLWAGGLVTATGGLVALTAGRRPRRSTIREDRDTPAEVTAGV